MHCFVSDGWGIQLVVLYTNCPLRIIHFPFNLERTKIKKKKFVIWNTASVLTLAHLQAARTGDRLPHLRVSLFLFFPLECL